MSRGQDSSNRAPIVIRFGSTRGDFIELRVLCLNDPDAESAWYRAQLNVELEARFDGVHGRSEMVMFTDDFHRFRRDLAAAGRTSSTLESGDSFTLDVLHGSDGPSVRLQTGELYDDHWEILVPPSGNVGDGWDRTFAISRASLDALTGEVIRVSERFPWWTGC